MEILYADDTVLYFHHKDLREIEKAITNDLRTLSNWLQDNELLLNTKKGKTEAMLFGTKARLNKEGSLIEIDCNGTIIRL